MALRAAVLLSGLDKQAFGEDLDEVFLTGAKLLKSPSESSIGSTVSQESGISSMSSGRSSKNLAPFFDLLTNDLKVDGEDAATDDPISLNVKVYVEEETTAVDLPPSEIESAENVTTPVPSSDLCMKKTVSLEIMYENRNILDLYSNIAWGGWPCQPAIIRRGVAQFFDNRSPYSRLMGATMPPHKTLLCDKPDCHYEEPLYF